MTYYETTEHNNQAAWNTNDQRPTFSLKDRSPQQKRTHTHKKKKESDVSSKRQHTRARFTKEGGGWRRVDSSQINAMRRFSSSSTRLRLYLRRRSTRRRQVKNNLFSTTSDNTNTITDDDGVDGDDELSNYEDLMAMEDSYGSGVSASEHAAAEANAKLLQQRQKVLEEREKRGIQVGDRVRVHARKGAPYPDLSMRKKYYDDRDSVMSAKTGGGARVGVGDYERKQAANAEGSKKRRFDIRPVVGYVVEVRNDRVGVKRNERVDDSDISYPTFPRSWVEQLDIGEMWEMNTGSRNGSFGSFSSAEDAAFYQSEGVREQASKP